MSITSFHLLGALFITASILFLGLAEYYSHLMRRQIRGRLPESRWNWLLVWIAIPHMHGFYFPDSQMRKKYYFSIFGTFICGYLAMRVWMK